MCDIFVTGTTLSSKLTRASEVLGLIDTKRMAKTCVRFPLHLTLDMEEESDAGLVDDQLYDPRFFLPLTAQVCRPGAFVDRHLKLVESGALGKTSSSSPFFIMFATTSSVQNSLSVALLGSIDLLGYINKSVL